MSRETLWIPPNPCGWASASSVPAIPEDFCLGRLWNGGGPVGAGWADLAPPWVIPHPETIGGLWHGQSLHPSWDLQVFTDALFLLLPNGSGSTLSHILLFYPNIILRFSPLLSPFIQSLVETMRHQPHSVIGREAAKHTKKLGFPNNCKWSWRLGIWLHAFNIRDDQCMKMDI